MTVQVKICGISSEAALDAALQAGADYFGLVFYPPSPRNVDLETARRLAGRGRGRAKSVALMVDPDDAEIAKVIETVDPDLIQLHGHETPARVRAIRKLAARPVVKAVKVRDASDVAAAAAYEGAADLILYDAPAPEDTADALPGGNGVPFDWRALTGVHRDANYMLSGGLTADNVGQAIEISGATTVDVSSGVESAPGVKDPELIRRFIAAAKAAETDAGEQK